MFVRDRMTAPAVTVPPDTPFQDALMVMQENAFRRLPVIDKKGKLVGIIAERDLLYASPSQATSLSVWEMNYLLSKITVQELMTLEVITTTPDTTIEGAANLMVEKGVGGLPVIDEERRPVGMITETDIFKTLAEMFGASQAGLRLTLEVPRGKGVLAQLSKAIFELGGDITSIGSFPIPSRPQKDGLVMKVQEVSREDLLNAIEAMGDHVTDAREV